MRLFALLWITAFGSGVGSGILAQTATTAGPTHSMNPDVSVNALTLYSYAKRSGNDKAEDGGGLALQEVEMQFTADVDPYLKASALLSVHPEEAEQAPVPTTTPAPQPEPKEHKFAIEPEEVFLETISIPNVTFKLGRFHAALGRHNSLHTHAFPFIDAPIISQKLLGEDGLTEVGLSAAVLLPASWFAEVTAQALQGDSPTLFASESSTDMAYVYRLRNLFDVTDSMTLDVGLSGASGANFYGDRTAVSGADLTIKWRPSQGGKYASFIFSTEYLKGEVKGRPEEEKLSGLATWVQYQFAERWWLQARTEQCDTGEDDGKETKHSLLLSFFPSEFSGFRLQVARLSDKEDKPLDTVALQGNFTIGAHPAHAY